jgi:hypothetical protein
MSPAEIFEARGPAGGMIADGTYLLTRYDIYPPSSVGGSLSSKETLRITGNRLEDARIDQDAPTTTTNINLSFSASGTALAMTRTCGAMGSFSQDFTATATTLSFIGIQPLVPETSQLDQDFRRVSERSRSEPAAANASASGPAQQPGALEYLNVL